MIGRKSDHEATQGSSQPGTCERCGRAMDVGGVERLSAKLAQLARFGLAGYPLLARRQR